MPDWQHRQGHGSPQNWPGPGVRVWKGFGRLVFLFFGLMTLAFVGLVFFGVWSLFKLVLGNFPLLVAIPLGLAVLGLVMARSAWRTWRPVSRIISATGALADGDYSVRVEPTGRGSLRAVVHSFNSMAGRLEDSNEQRRRLLADLGHELRTPLTVIRGEIEAMLDGVHETDPDHLGMLLDEVGLMERLLEDLRTLSLTAAGTLTLHPEPTDLVELVEDVADAQRRTADEQGVLIAVKAVDSVPEVMVDPHRIREVMSNLVVNSIRAMPDGGAITMQVSASASAVTVAVSDSGIGIHADELPHVFDRFHKGATSAGSGLGLTISRDLVEAHGGTIDLASEPGLGTIVRVTLPR